jgi:hypothetical protein
MVMLSPFHFFSRSSFLLFSLSLFLPFLVFLRGPRVATRNLTFTTSVAFIGVYPNLQMLYWKEHGASHREATESLKQLYSRLIKSINNPVSFVHGHMVMGSHGLPKVSPGPAMRPTQRAGNLQLSSTPLNNPRPTPMALSQNQRTSSPSGVVGAGVARRARRDRRRFQLPCIVFVL